MNRLRFTLTVIAILGWYQYYLRLVDEGNVRGYFLIVSIIGYLVWRISGYVVNK